MGSVCVIYIYIYIFIYISLYLFIFLFNFLCPNSSELCVTAECVECIKISCSLLIIINYYFIIYYLSFYRLNVHISKPFKSIHTCTYTHLFIYTQK